MTEGFLTSAGILSDQPAPANEILSPIEDNGPIPLSFPAVLRNPGISDRFAHLRATRERSAPPTVLAKKNRRDDHEGKRWIRRKENAKFIGNPHIVLATKKDYILAPPHARSTFPEPLPSYLPRTAKVPTATPPTLNPATANAGRFSLSLKGMRRTLRKSGARTEALVRDVEGEIVQWLEGGTMFMPDALSGDSLNLPGKPVGSTEVVYEISRTPLQLVWSITDDAFARYVVHCCARYHEVVSFSKEHSDQRLTYLLRPNVTRPDFDARRSLDTPPITDLEYSSYEVDTESDFISDRDNRPETGDSDVELNAPPAGALPAISENTPGSLPSVLEDGWSVVGDSDIEGDESGSEYGLARDVETLSLNDTDRTPRAVPRMRQTALRTRVWDHRQARSASSPSRSPARRPPRRMPLRFGTPPIAKVKPKSFYEYLFA